MARPVGSTTKPQFRDYIFRMKNGAQRMGKLLDKTLTDAETNPDLAKWCLDHFFGKAPQAVEMTGKDGENLFAPEPNETVKQLVEKFEVALRETFKK